MDWGDGVDTTDKSVIWNDGETEGKNSQGEIVEAPAPESVEDTLKAEILDLLQDGGLDSLKSLLPDQIFVEEVKEKPIEPIVEDEEPLPDDDLEESD